MKKKLIGAILIVALLAATVTVIAIRRKTETDTPVGGRKSFDTMEELLDAAPFDILCSDRLARIPATGFAADGSTVEITYGDAGYTRKTYAVTDNSGADKAYPDSKEVDVNGMKVTLRGSGESFFEAVWQYNNYAYTVSLSEATGGADEEEMINYVMSTR